MEKIKITMLGTTNSGKTCYMVGMYAVMQLGLNGFTFSAKDMDLDLELSDYWETMINKQGEERWPPATAPNNAKKYDFSFNYGFNPLMEFEWLDYRGGAMSDKENQEDVRLLIEQISNSSCLFLGISGEHLQEKIKLSTASSLKANRINQWIQQVSDRLKPSLEKPFPVAVIINKYDYCRHRDKEQVIEDVKKLFQGLFTPKAGWLVMICPVTLGKELTEDPARGEIDPINMQLPVYFAIYSKLREYAVDRNAEREQGSRIISNLGSNWFKRWWNSTEIKGKENDLQPLEGEITHIESYLRLLSQELQSVPIYLGGQEVQLDV